MRTLSNPTAPLTVAALLTLCGAGTAAASDARSIALGGSVIAAGEGVPGALANPSALMQMQRRGERTHVRVGVSGELRDDAELIDIASDDDNRTLANDTEEEIESIDLSEVSCDPLTATRDTVCLDGLAPLSALTTRALDIIDQVDGEAVIGQVTADAGLAFTAFTYPFALHLQTRATGRGRARVDDADRDYLGAFATQLADGELSFGEVEDSAQFTIDEEARQLRVQQPEDVLDSSARGGFAARVTLGASLATSVTVGGLDVDVGVTPKLSSITVQGVEAAANEEFEDGTPSLEDRLDASEVSEAAFTFDVGATTALDKVPLRLAAVLRNVVPESIETDDGVVFETTPQLVVGGVYERGAVALNADLALNEAERDSLPTQVLALGIEFAAGPLALRGGINHDAAREAAATALSLGFGAGPFDLGLRASSLSNTQAGAQLSFSF